jgi:hypothetical protein
VTGYEDALFPEGADGYEAPRPGLFGPVERPGVLAKQQPFAHRLKPKEDHQKNLGGAEPRTLAFSFCIVTIGVLSDETSLTRLDDKTWR